MALVDNIKKEAKEINSIEIPKDAKTVKDLAKESGLSEALVATILIKLESQGSVDYVNITDKENPKLQRKFYFEKEVSKK